MTATPLPEKRERLFNLLRWFSLLGLLVVTLISLSTSYLLSQFLEEHLLKRDAAVLQDFVGRIAQHHDPARYFDSSYSLKDGELNDFFTDIAHMPDVARTNAFDTDFNIVWSSDLNIIGERVPDNDELAEALEGKLVYERGHVEDLGRKEPGLDAGGINWFVENYIPIRDNDSGKVVGVVEIYRIPVALSQSIAEGRRLVWTSVMVGGLILFITLFSIIRHGDELIRSQHHRLLGQTRLATIGEMASSVAHSIRNPIASIRSSAELAMDESDQPEIVESMEDIINEVDRFDGWIKELLTFTNSSADPDAQADIGDVVESSLATFIRRAERVGISIEKRLPEGHPIVSGDHSLLVQVMNSLIANAMDAMPRGGQLVAEVSTVGDSARLRLSDTGFGIPPDRLVTLFDPLVTHKNGGLGIGLALARQVIHRYHGSIGINSTVGSGTHVNVVLPLRSV